MLSILSSALRRPAFLALAACAALSGCSSWLNPQTNPAVSTGSYFDKLQPYRLEIVQGNVITQESMAQIQPGLGRAQVRDILGTPLLADIFHADRWDFVFTIARQGVKPQQRKVTIHFKNDVVERFETEPLPSEREFVASISKAPSNRKAEPDLSEAQVKALPIPEKAKREVRAPQGANREFPPLEAGIN